MTYSTSKCVPTHRVLRVCERKDSPHVGEVLVIPLSRNTRRAGWGRLSKVIVEVKAIVYAQMELDDEKFFA